MNFFILRLINLFICFLLYNQLVAQSENVGIGTSSPTERLDVQGNIKADTLKPNALLLPQEAGTGKILTSDELGNATWQAMMVPPENDESGNVGYGVWGDCKTNGNISGYQPVADTSSANYKFFGFSVDMSGNFAVVGSHQDGVPGASGTASIYFYNGMGWELLQVLTDPDAAAGDKFGASVSIFDEYVMVGSPRDDDTFTDQGSVCVFHFNGSTWDFVEKLYHDSPAFNDQFGTAVSITLNKAIVGSPYHNLSKGTASIYQFNGVNWDFMSLLYNPDEANFDYFGSSVSISGDLAAIGVPEDDVGSNSNQGSVIVFIFNGNSWVWLQTLTTGSANDYYGRSVAIEGNNLLVGANGDDIDYTDQGSASFYIFNGTTWLLKQTLKDKYPTSNALFGTSVSLAGQYAMIGSPLDIEVNETINAGSVSIFQRLGAGWQPWQIVFDPGGIGGDYFGQSIAMDSETGLFVIGAFNYLNASGKVVFGKIN